jgi:hypothetical protein|eukprot:TRINITY_DN83409_c0_g1_i1.p1 TRINITY_DN83409_c0_g1~~TRINITY_DN83409_c0_g1_i1.p1  ORF type:complete len:152 (+),score=15.49 TRINITY_DN83409_c0_g1_i1:152-607(+)
MKRVWGALGLVLALTVFMPRVSAAQSSQDGRERRNGATLGQNFPNPFNPETRIPFSVGDAPTCSDNSKQYRVSLRVYNIVYVLVATPVLQGGTSGVAGGQPLQKVSIPCGEYIAYWDGKVQATGREAASGTYYYILEVDGVPLVRKMIVVK